MTKRTLFLLAVTLLFSAAACEKQAEKPINPVPANYRDWSRPVKKPLLYPVPGHSISKRIIYANSLAWKPKMGEDKNGDKTIEYPPGSIVIKEVYKQVGGGYVKEPQLTIMVKDPNSVKAQRGWLYYVRGPGQAQPVLIENKTCIGCHEAANERHPYFDQNREGLFRDFLFVSLAR